MATDANIAARRRTTRLTGMVAALLAAGSVALVALACVRATGGDLVYVLDDAYIHLAMGRTLAESGVWGLNANTPGAASSSPLWTLLLAGLTLAFGAQTWLPLALNIVAAGALALAADFWLRQLSLRPGWRIAAIAAVIVIGPIGPLAMTGMEHVAHAAAILLLLALALRHVPARPLALGLAAALATGFRYESAFVAAALAPVMALRGDWRRAVALFVGPTVVVLGVGVMQLHAGEGLLPNSLIVKAVAFSLAAIGDWLRWKAFGAVQGAFEAPILGLPLLACLLAWAAASRIKDGEAPAGVAVAMRSASALAVAMLLHITLARTGWFHRYEAYLLIWGVVSVAISARAWQITGGESLPRGALRSVTALGLAVTVVLMLLALGTRIQAWEVAPEAALDIAAQHREMARFAHRYYDGTRLVLNDVGYVSYATESPILDLGGLAAHEVAVAKSEGWYDARWVRQAAERFGAEVAIVYDLPVTPEAWDKVATWDTKSVRVGKPGVVQFYALKPGARDRLLAHLREFESTLHPRIEVTYYPAREG